MNKLILIMIDGLSAQKFEAMRTSLPHLNELAIQGTQIKTVTPEICGTSFPGRTSILVGRPPSEHGVYGNRIWDKDVFRWANPYDVRTSTIATFAKQAGLDVANVGFGMVRPEDCAVYISPWWVGDVMSRARDEQPHIANDLWTMKDKILDPDNRLDKANIDLNLIVDPTNYNEVLQLGMLADHQLMEAAANLIDSDHAPDFLMLEVGITDYYLHAHGVDHALTELSLRMADAQVGCLLARLRSSGKLKDYNFAIMSDHGHTPMTQAIHCDHLFGPGITWSSEGGMLLVAASSQREATKVTDIALAEDLQLWDNSFIPEELRDQLLVFTSKQGSLISFENDYENTGQIHGTAKYKSSHGMRPGSVEDYRFCLFSGPQVPQQVIEFGQAIQVAPTMAAIMGIKTDWLAEPFYA